VSEPHTDEPMLGPRYLDGFVLASEVHGRQLRKGSNTPCLAHLMGVSALVLEHGGDEDCAIAGLLHDAIEDSDDGNQMSALIAARFGERVRGIVWACSDAVGARGVQKPEWHRRKQEYIAHLETVDADALLVSACDKIHNARAIVADLRVLGEGLWQRFSTRSGEDQVWYYTSLADVFSRRMPGPLADELRRVVDEMGVLERAGHERA
jgi:(p)ppGpp synthase/HD superfamily hydrolase